MTTINQSVAWKSPSNIAIVKYWGKTGLQLPLNPSISFSLENCYTNTRVDYCLKEKPTDESFAFLFEGNSHPPFEPKLKHFFQYVFERYPLLRQYKFDISSENSFPHSAGIASSASAMCALSFCLIQIHNRIRGDECWPNADEVGSLARLGSGSACRSTHGGWMMWGTYPYMAYSNDNYAISINDHVHDLFRRLCDTVLVISSQRKQVSSSLGHQMMTAHPYGKARIDQALDNTAQLLDALKEGDFDRFAKVCEEEALSLHALMMSSRPGFMLMHPNTLTAIDRIRQHRQQTGLPVCFTLDAGPNIHLIYPETHRPAIRDWIVSELLPLCENQLMIDDCLGAGSVPIVI